MAALRAMNITGLTKFQFDFVSNFSTTPKRFVLSGSPGSGRTIAYGITILKHVDSTKNYPQVLCLCSTYESATQVEVLSRMEQVSFDRTRAFICDSFCFEIEIKMCPIYIFS